MKLHLRHYRPWIVFAFLMISLGLGDIVLGAESITRLSSKEELHSLKKFHSIPNFRLGGAYRFGDEAAYEYGGDGGVTLESLGQEPLRVAYITAGIPKRDKEGKIINAVVIFSYYSGDATDMVFFWQAGQPGVEFSEGPVVGPGRLIDTDRYFVIYVDSIGLWGASKPSDGLGMRFPDYTYMDIVQANYRLLKDVLGVKKVKLATGVSMGGGLAYVLAILHPDFVDAIIPIGANSFPDNVARWTFRLMTEAVKSDPAWRKTQGDYYKLPRDEKPGIGLKFAWSILEHTAYDFNYRVTQNWQEDVLGYVFSWDPEEGAGSYLDRRAQDFDANDILIRNRTCDKYNINEQLSLIKAKTLVVHARNDHWLIYRMAEWTSKQIPGAKIVGFDSPLAHYAIFRAPHVLRKDFLGFFKEAGIVPGGNLSWSKPQKTGFEK